MKLYRYLRCKWVPVISLKNLKKKKLFVFILKATEEKCIIRNRSPIRIRIRSRNPLLGIRESEFAGNP